MSDSVTGSQQSQAAQGVILPATLPILPISEAVIFPYMMVPLVLSDENLIKLADECLAGDKILGAFAQRPQPALSLSEDEDGDLEPDHDEADQIYEVGTAVRIQKMLRFPDGSMRLLGQGSPAAASRPSCRRSRTCARRSRPSSSRRTTIRRPWPTCAGWPTTS
jgi:ATP-dependent Lon protease